MPIGEHECQPVAAELAQCQPEEGAVVEEGRDHWKYEKEGERRRKRKVNVTGIKHMEHEIQEPHQVCGNKRSCEVNPAYQQLQDGHNTHTKRQQLDGYDTIVDVPPQEQHHGYEDDDVCAIPMTGAEGGIPVDHSDIATLPEEEEDIVCVMKRQLAEANNLLSKCGEALSEGIAYEAFFPVRIDEMLRATHSLEQSLLYQKQTMKDRLQAILGLL